MGLGGIVAGVGSLLGAVSSDRSSRRATNAQEAGQERALAIQQQAAQQARNDAIPLFQDAQQNQLGGFQSALDVLAGTIPAQMDAFQSGNVGAQETLLAGLDPFQQAILGQNINTSGLQAQELRRPSANLFSQQLPEFQSINQSLGIETPEVEVNGGAKNVDLNRPRFREPNFRNRRGFR